MFIRRKLIIILAIGIIALILASGCKKQEEKIITGVYSSWNWTPDGRVIFSMITHEILHTGPFQAMGYKHGTSVTKVCIMNNDGTDFKVLHEAPYMSIEQKWELRKEELEKKGIVGKELSDQVGLEQKSGKLDELYPDPALSHIGGIDWNKNNNKLVFVANDGKGKNGIAVSDPEFREVKWIKKVKDMDIYYTSFSHTGDEITYLMNGDIYIIDVTTSDEKQITKGIIIGMPSFMPDDQNLLTGKGIIDFNGIFVEKFKQGLGDPAISPNGEWVAYAGRRTGFEMINLKTGEKKEILKTGDFPKWSPDGQWVLTGWEGEIVKDNPYSGEKISLRPRK